MNKTFNKALLTQLLEIYKRQGLWSLIIYIVMAFNYRVINKYFRGSYSQKSEDLAIYKYFNSKAKGFYIDVGASHPERFNNTKFFYDRGWKGINVEPSPTRITLFKNQRKRDTNLNIGIGSKKGKFNFYEFEPASLSTFSEKEANILQKVGYPLKRKIQVPMYRLETIMKKYVKSEIDFMTVDTEGLDMEVLKSNDWKKFRPRVLCVETIDFIDLMSGEKSVSNRRESISNYLKRQGYEEYLNNGLNTIYMDKRN